MIRDLGIVPPGTTLYLPFHTFDSNDPSASVTLSGLATTDIEIYKDGSMTQRASDNGYTLLDTDGIDLDGVTGIHGLSIDLADNSTAGFYAAGSQYWVVISSVTVDAATINFILATFRIGQPGAVLNTTIATLSSQTSFTLTAGPAEDDALNGCIVRIHDVASAVQAGFGVVQDYTGSTKTVTLTAGVTFTAAATDNISFFPPANAQYGGTVAYSTTRGLSGTALPNAAADAAGGLIISDAGGLDADAQRSDVAAILVDTGTTLDARIPASLSGGRMRSDMEAISADATAADNLETAYDDTAGPVPHMGILDQGTAQSATATTLVLRAASAFGNNTLAGATAVVFGSTQGYWQATAITANTLADDTCTVNTFKVPPTGTITYKIFASPDAADAFFAELADTVWDEATAGHTTSGTFGEQVKTDIDEILTDTGTTLQAEVDGIQADTEDIQSRLPAALTADGNIKADTLRIGGTLQTANDVGADVNDILADTADMQPKLGTPAGASISADIAAIEAQTDDIGAAGAGLTAIPWNAAWDAEVQSEATDALNAYDPPTRTEATADKDEILTQLPSSPVKNATFTYVIKMVDSNGDAVTGLTVGFTRSLDAAAFGAGTGTVTEISTGHYKVAASAADMNGDVVAHRFTGTGAKDLTVEFKTVS